MYFAVSFSSSFYFNSAGAKVRSAFEFHSTAFEPFLSFFAIKKAYLFEEFRDFEGLFIIY